MCDCTSEVCVCNARRTDRRNLLPVLGQHFIAGPAEPGAMLLETTQNGIVAVVHHGPAMARDVPRAGLMSRLTSLLGRRRGSEQDKRSNEKNPDHLVAPYLSHTRDQIPLCR
jgi:hypothetical protein